MLPRRERGSDDVPRRGGGAPEQAPSGRSEQDPKAPIVHPPGSIDTRRSVDSLATGTWFAPTLTRFSGDPSAFRETMWSRNASPVWSVFSSRSRTWEPAHTGSAGAGKEFPIVSSGMTPKKSKYG